MDKELKEKLLELVESLESAGDLVIEVEDLTEKNLCFDLNNLGDEGYRIGIFRKRDFNSDSVNGSLLVDSDEFNKVYFVIEKEGKEGVE